jgi:hypothetical protein
MKLGSGPQAATQALMNILGEIPPLRMKKVSEGKNTSGPNFKIGLQIQNHPYSILLEYKASGQPRIARQAAHELKDQLAKGLGEYGVFSAPYISPQAAAVCKEFGIGYLDLTGNCLLSFETIFIQREGIPNSRIQRRELRSLYSTKAERILRVLLSKPNQSWKTKDLAEAARVSFGQVSNVKKLLANREWLDTNQEGIRLNNPAAALDDWAIQYRFSRNQTIDYYALTDVVESERKLAEVCRKEGIRYALTAFSAAARVAPAVRYQRVAAYIDGDLDYLTASLEWKQVSSGSNINLLVPYDEGIFFDAREIEDTSLVTPVQIFLDLQNYRGRGQEAAQAVRKVIDQSW